MRTASTALTAIDVPERLKARACSCSLLPKGAAPRDWDESLPSIRLGLCGV